MPAYSLYLSTQITTPTSNAVVPLNKNNLSNCSWRVDWDNLFCKEQMKYKNCRVRFSLMTISFAASTPVSTDWLNYSGYISASLPTMYNADTTTGTILGMIYPMDCPISGTGIHCLQVSSMGEIGVDIITPTGVSQLNIMMCNDDTMSLMTAFQEYQLLLSFELY